MATTAVETLSYTLNPLNSSNAQESTLQGVTTQETLVSPSPKKKSRISRADAEVMNQPIIETTVRQTRTRVDYAAVNDPTILTKQHELEQINEHIAEWEKRVDTYNALVNRKAILLESLSTYPLGSVERKEAETNIAILEKRLIRLEPTDKEAKEIAKLREHVYDIEEFFYMIRVEKRVKELRRLQKVNGCLTPEEQVEYNDLNEQYIAFNTQKEDKMVDEDCYVDNEEEEEDDEEEDEDDDEEEEDEDDFEEDDFDEEETFIVDDDDGGWGDSDDEENSDDEFSSSSKKRRASSGRKNNNKKPKNRENGLPVKKRKVTK